ncbi:MAG: hypothetical protein GF364_04595 [Candidatus Lokiarchaeota archaeon]|nr:hypothetical protein [Candidatus Lokiarchaeota archaeon]
MTESKKTTDMNRNDSSDIFGRGILYALILFQLIVLPWVFNNLLVWSDFDLNDPLILSFLVLAIVIMLFYVPLIPRIARFHVFTLLLKKFLIYVFLAIEIAVELILYLYIRRLINAGITIPGQNGGLSAGWLRTETVPIMLSSIWILVAGGLIVPSIITILYASRKDNTNFSHSLHVGSIIFSALMLFQWGATWALPLNHLVFTAILIPMLIYFSPETEENKKIHNNLFNMEFFPAAGIFYLFAYWLFLIPFQSENTLSENMLWLAFASTNLILLLYSKKNSGFIQNFQEKKVHVKQILLLNWIILLLMSVFILLSALNAFFSNLRIVWIVISLVNVSLLPEIVLYQQKPSKKLKTLIGFRIFIWIFSGLLGIAIHMGLNMFDPLSTYVGFFLLGFNTIFVLPTFLKKRF